MEKAFRLENSAKKTLDRIKLEQKRYINQRLKRDLNVERRLKMFFCGFSSYFQLRVYFQEDTPKLYVT